MAKNKKKGLQMKWIIIAIILTVVLSFGLLKIYNKTQLSKEEAVKIVSSLPEVKEYLKQIPQALIQVNGEENEVYLIQVYEIKNGHTATFNWYKVNKTNREVIREF